MSKRYIVPLIFVILIVAAVFHNYLKRRPSGIEPFAKARDIKRMKISDFSKKKSFELVKKGVNWFVVMSSTKFVTNGKKVKNLANKLKKIKFETVISENPAKHFDYSVSSSNAISVEIFGRKKYPVVYIGKSGADYYHFYARFKDRPQIYLASGIKRYEVTRGANFYRDHRIINLKKDDVTKVTIVGNGKKYSVEKSSNTWKFNGKPPEKFDEVLAACSNISAFDFAGGGFEKKVDVEVTDKSGRVFRWSIGQKEENYYLAKRPDRNDIYKVSSYRIDKILNFLKQNGKAKG